MTPSPRNATFMRRPFATRRRIRNAPRDAGAPICESSEPMSRLTAAQLERIALDAGRTRMYQQDKVWSRYSSDKVDIAATLGQRGPHAVPRAAARDAASPRSRSARATSRSSASWRRSFPDGLYLLDIEEAALDVVAERIARQRTRHVTPDPRRLPRSSSPTTRARGASAPQRPRRPAHDAGHAAPLALLRAAQSRGAASSIASTARCWRRRRGPGPSAAIHAVLMASRSDDPRSTTWLYNHFAGRFFGRHNDQDLRACARELRRDPAFAGRRCVTKSSRVEFFVDDFEQFMAVVWMILLHPNVHASRSTQQRARSSSTCTRTCGAGAAARAGAGPPRRSTAGRGPGRA